jgi:hypothetical protein
MASVRQIAANRKNARGSTGPRTAATKARVSRNALRHGLAIPITRDPKVSAEIDQLALTLAGPAATPVTIEQAHIAVEAQFEILRVRTHRCALIDLRAAELAANHPATATGERSGSEASSIVGVLPSLEALERYERRAVSRRKRAIRWLIYTAMTTTG